MAGSGPVTTVVRTVHVCYVAVMLKSRCILMTLWHVQCIFDQVIFVFQPQRVCETVQSRRRKESAPLTQSTHSTILALIARRHHLSMHAHNREKPLKRAFKGAQWWSTIRVFSRPVKSRSEVPNEGDGDTSGAELNTFPSRTVKHAIYRILGRLRGRYSPSSGCIGYIYN